MDLPPNPCRFEAGQIGEMLGGGFIEHPNGTICPLVEIEWNEGAGFRFHYESEEAQMPEVDLPTPEPVQSGPPPSPVEAPAPVAAPVAAPIAPAPVEATTVAPDPTTAAGELAGLAQAAGGDSILAIVLVAAAVLGGGAAWKFYQKNSEQKHEFRMKELEMKSQAPSQSPPPCVVKHGEIDAKVAALEGKVGKLDQRTSGMSVDGPSTDELDERLVKAERALKALVSKKPVSK